MSRFPRVAAHYYVHIRSVDKLLRYLDHDRIQKTPPGGSGGRGPEYIVLPSTLFTEGSTDIPSRRGGGVRTFLI